MKFFRLLLSLALPLVFLSNASAQDKLSKTERTLLDQALNNAGKNKPELSKALKAVPAKELRAMAFLITYMPQTDRETLTANFLLNNVREAYKARENFSWCKSLPDSVFFNEVLPYAMLDEHRDDWRQDFYNRFTPLVANCTDIYAAIDSVNRKIAKLLKTDYNTKRKKVNQSPYESIDQGMATCTGLSILLVDAFRAVGIPSRLAGIPNWTTKKGNHNWVEVLIDGKWYFTEYYPDALNKSWFVADAGKADPARPEYSIYATSFKPTQTYFPLIWDSTQRNIHGYNVTKRYIDIYNEQLRLQQLPGDEMILNVVLFKDESCTPDGNNRIHSKITLIKDGKETDFGFSPSPTDDMNKFLVFKVKKNSKYTLEFAALDKTISTEIVTTADGEMTQRLYVEKQPVVEKKL